MFWQGFTLTVYTYLSVDPEISLCWAMELVRRSQKDMKPLSPTITASQFYTILTSSTLVPYQSDCTYLSGSLQQKAFPEKSPDKMPYLDHSKANPPFRVPSSRCTGNSLPSLKRHTGPSSVRALITEESCGLCLALLISCQWVNLQVVLIRDAGISQGSSLRLRRVGKVTYEMQMCSACALPDECEAQRHLQTVYELDSYMKGSHWKVREGHLSLWMKSRSQRKPAFSIHTRWESLSW